MKKLGMIEILTIGVIGLILLASLVPATFPLFTKSEVTITVENKENIKSGDIGKYLIFTDIETFENSDCLLLGKFDSSDMYNDIKEGKKYKAKVYGFRIPFLSMYRNIYEIEEVLDREVEVKDALETE